MKRIVKALAVPLILLATLVIFLVIAQVFFPTPDMLLDILKHYFAIYGYPVLFLSGVIESIPVINIYFPGSSIILLGAAFSRQGSLNIYMVIFIGLLAIAPTYFLNYLIGYHGWHKIFDRFGWHDAIAKSQKQVEKHGSWWIWVSYVHPNIGALTSTAYGIVKSPFKNFMVQSIFAVLFWNAFWGFLMYFASDQLITILTARWLVIAALALFVGIKIIIELRKKP